MLLSNNEVCTTWITLKILPLVNIKMSLDDVKVIDEVKTPPPAAYSDVITLLYIHA